MKKFFRLAAILSVFATLFSCKTTGSIKENENFPPAGVTFHKAENYSIVEINLFSPDLILVSGPKASGWHKAVSACKFAEQNNAFVAINANPFNIKNRLNQSVVNTVGIYSADGIEYSPAAQKYAAIAFYRAEKGYTARIYENQSQISSAQCVLAAGGFFKILEEDRIFEFKDIKDFRSAAGISRNGRILYLLCGKKMSYMDCAEILQQHGAYSALEFDGGSSSQMIFNGKKIQSHFVNRKPAVILGFANKSYNKIDE